jgi:hypothetical protein
MNELHIGLAFMASPVLPVAVALSWRGLRHAYRRLRNLDALEDAERGRRIARKMAFEAQTQIVGGRLQLAACRAVLEETMRERDHYRAQAAHLAGRVIELERKRREERLAARTWLTRTILSRKVSEN